MKNKMPSPKMGKSTNPAATTGGGGAPTINGQTSSAKIDSKIRQSPRDPARGNHKNGNFSQ